MAKSVKPIAYKPMSNWGGVEILYADGDKVIVRDNYGTPRQAHSAKVRFNANGEPYFKHNGRREYIHHYLRCN